MTSTDGLSSAPKSTQNRPALSNMQVRILAGVPWLLGALLCLAWGEWPWAIFITLGAVVGVLEFYEMTRGRPEQAVTPVGAVAALLIMLGVEVNQPALWIGAFFAAGLLGFALARRRDPPNAARQAAMTLLGLVYVAFPLATTEILRR